MEWEEFEYQYYEKSQSWYWWVGGIGLVAVVLALLFSNILFAILLALSAVVIIMYAARHPDKIFFALHSHGVQMGKRLYPYENLKTFWVLDVPGRPRKIIITSKKIFLPHIVFPLHDEMDSEEVRDFLAQYLPEGRVEESAADKLSDYFGF
ncbi:MAG: hypothetical protein U9M92_01240 [Patescibacteria group bacterium]|nr:hypothetical protein [Patescibacteria group bacterium]